MPKTASADVQAYGGQTDVWLAERCRDARDDAAFAEIVTRYRDRVFRLAVSILGQEFAADAEDVAQDVFVRVHGALPSFRGQAALGTWIYRIAFNHTLNVKERMRFRAPHVNDDALVTRPVGGVTPDEALDRQRRHQAVLAAVRELPEVYQSALRLHYWLGASVADIAELLDAPENTVKSYLHRGRRLVQVYLQERGIDA